ncbi:transposase [Mycobacterium tuberculosis T85]|nr:transposase [Mycobacterium tuberculosis T85]
MAKTASWCAGTKFAGDAEKTTASWGRSPEAITQVPARVRSTLRLRRQMAKAIGDAARSVGRGRPG